MSSRALRKHYGPQSGPAAPTRTEQVRAVLQKGVRTPVSVVLEFLGIGALAAIPLFKDFGVVDSPWWLCFWLLAYVAKEVYGRYRLGAYADGGSQRVLRIHSSVAGSIDSLTMKLVSSGGDRRLNEDGSKQLCISLLSRIKDFVASALHIEEDIRLRCTLAVPMQQGGKTTSVRVWCYDQPYDDRRWTDLPLNKAGIGLVPGSPTAFVTGGVQIIPDVHEEPSAPQGRERKFRSVLSIPIKAGGPNGQTLAVLNVDASKPNLFDETDVERAIMPLVAPSVNVIALVLLTRREGERYAFNS